MPFIMRYPYETNGFEVMKMKNVKAKSTGLFPLSLVILPNESIRLHIYQTAFKALVNDCFATGNDFVVPFVYNGKTTDFGTCVKLVDVERFYPDGKMDIKVEGSHIVRISNFGTAKNMAYATGQAEMIESNLPQIHSSELRKLFTQHLENTHQKISVELDKVSVYDIAKSLKLSKEIKIKLLRNASNSIVQSKIVLNELRLLVLTHKLQDEAGFRYYMN